MRYLAWMLLVVIVGISQLRDKIFGLSKNYGKTWIWFAWYPVKTNTGWIWLKKVNRFVTCNSDMISIASYGYSQIK